MDAVPSSIELLLRTLLAVFGGAVLGWQRELHGKPAGLRTQMMVGLGAAMFTMATLKFHQSALAADLSPADPLRVISGIVGGIGFLGAGTIIQARESIKGMTTAATVWVVGAFGIACGLGYYFLASINLVFAFVILSGVGVIERRFVNRASELSQSRNDESSDQDSE